MTRVNVVPPEILSNKHLIAEYHELPRVFRLAAAHDIKKPLPAEYNLGPGHVAFFYNKLEWVQNRCRQLVAEMKARGYNCSYTGDFSLWRESTHPSQWNDWQPTEQCLARNSKRLLERQTDHYRLTICYHLAQKAEGYFPEATIGDQMTQTNRRGRKPMLAGHKLQSAVETNPRRKNTSGHRSFEIILDNPGITTETFVQSGGRLNDLIHDYKKGRIVAQA